MPTKRTPTYSFDPTRSFSNAPNARTGPRNRHAGRHRLTICHLAAVDSTDSDYIDIADMGLRGLIDCSWRPIAVADAAMALPDVATGRVTFSGVNAACAGELWLLTAC